MAAQSSSTHFQGSFVALITPFRDGALDEESFAKIVNWHVEQGTDGLVPVGTTGESPTLSHEEHKRVVELCVEVADGRIPVVAGAGSNSTAEAIDLAVHAKQAGADGALVVTPYYNKPTQAGLYRHFKAVQDAAQLPILIYNIPPRSVIDMSVDTMARLAELPHIVGCKDATTDLTRPLAETAACGPGFSLMSGEDATALAYLASGGHGCISVTANVAPGLCSQMHKAWQSGDAGTAMRINAQLFPLHQAMFCEASPGPVKYAAGLLGLCSSEARLPICEIADESKSKVERALKDLGLI